MMPKSFKDERGELVVNTIPSHLPAFPIRRFFLITGKEGKNRGNHAHKTCWQILMIISGYWNIKLDTLGGIELGYSNPRPTEIIIVEPNTWTSIEALSDDAQILVLCDKEYDEDDYIRDHAEFIKMRKGFRKQIDFHLNP